MALWAIPAFISVIELPRIPAEYLKNIDKITEKDISSEVINSLMNKIKEQLSKNTVSKSDEFYDMKPFSLEDLFEVKKTVFITAECQKLIYTQKMGLYQ